MRFIDILNESALEDAIALQWNKDISELYKWLKNIGTDKVIVTYRKQNNRNIKISYRSDTNEYPILELEDIFLTPDYVRFLEADGELLESNLIFNEYSIEFSEFKYSKEYTLKVKQWKLTDLKNLSIIELKKIITDSIKQVEKFCNKH